MFWMETKLNDGTKCYVCDEVEQVVIIEEPQGLKHHRDPRIVLEIWEGNIPLESVQKPTSFSILGIARYLDKYAEIGYKELKETYDEWNVPDGYLGYQIFHAWCAEPGYYDYCEHPPYQVDGVRYKWYEELENYRNSGGEHYAF